MHSIGIVKRCLIRSGNGLPSASMSFYGVLLVWFAIAAVMVTSVVLAVKVSVFALVIPLLIFSALFIKYGCTSH